MVPESAEVEAESKGEGVDNSNEDEQLSKDPIAALDLFGGQLPDVNRNNSHEYPCEGPLEEPGYQKQKDVIN